MPGGFSAIHIPTETTKLQSSSEPVLPLTSVRFFAALYVVLLHSAAWSHHLDTSSWAGRFLRTGYTAVGFFFVLSGYILAYVYLDTDRPFRRRAFWTSRFARVYPLLVASLLLDFPNDLMLRLAKHTATSAVARSFAALLSECLLLQAWDGRFRQINAPSWSLSAEAFFYLIFPFVAFWIWRRKGVAALRLVALLWIVALTVPSLITLYRPELFIEQDTSRLQWAVELMPVFRMFEFFAGIALCSLQRSLRAHSASVRTNRFAYLCLAVAIMLFWIAIEISNSIPLMVMSNGFLLPVYALTILGLANVRGWLANLLSLRCLVILGESSYAVYLLHSPIWFYLSRFRTIDSLSLWCTYLGIVISASIAAFFLLERPARKMILTWASVKPSITLSQEQAASHGATR